jgi:hypothetical protein
VLSARHTLFSVISRNEVVRNHLHASIRDIRRLELQTLLSLSALARDYSAYEQNLSAATYLQDMIPQCQEIGLNIHAVTMSEVARVLWDHGEPQSSIRILQRLSEDEQIEKEDYSPGRGMILAVLVC